jgi:hypothetical protein
VVADLQALVSRYRRLVAATIRMTPTALTDSMGKLGGFIPWNNQEPAKTAINPIAEIVRNEVRKFA